MDILDHIERPERLISGEIGPSDQLARYQSPGAQVARISIHNVEQLPRYLSNTCSQISIKYMTEYKQKRNRMTYERSHKKHDGKQWEEWIELCNRWLTKMGERGPHKVHTDYTFKEHIDSLRARKLDRADNMEYWINTIDTLSCRGPMRI